MNRTRIYYVIIFLLFFSPAKYFSQNASFTGLGDFPGGAFNSSAEGISNDGNVIVGYGTTETGEQSFYWTEKEGLVSLGNLPDSSFKSSSAFSVSADGSIIVGSGNIIVGNWNSKKGFLWTKDSGMVTFGSLNGATRYESWCVSADGSVIAGDGGTQGFWYSKAEGISGIGNIPGRNSGRAIDLSDDGLIAVGSCYSLPNWDNEQAFRWKKGEGIQGLGFLPGSNYSFALGISPEGNVIVGTGYSSGTYPGFRWTRETGMVNMGHLAGKQTTHPNDASSNGKYIVGMSALQNNSQFQAFIWDSLHGIRNLHTVLQTEYGLDLTGWTLQSAFAITPDGNIIVGYGSNPYGNQEAFRVVLDTLINTQETVKDIDGNIYNTVTIGKQVWMKENLKTTKYSNGDPIETTTSPTLNYSSELTPKYQWAYNGDENNVEVYGRLYTWYAATDNRGIAPVGWHVPSSNEWQTLIDYLGGAKAAHGKLKETGTTHWDTPNSDATNESGFTGVPGGSHWPEGGFDSRGMGGHYWSTSANNSNDAQRLLLNYAFLSEQAVLNSGDKKIGWSVRCIKDVTTDVGDSKKGNQIPEKMQLNQNYPNPFNPSTIISYQISENNNVKLKIYDSLGQEIKTLVDSFQNIGEYSVVWNATDYNNSPVCSGVYFYSLITNEIGIQKKMMFLR